MSDIWHKAGFHEAIDDKLKVSREGKWVYWTMYGWNIAGEDVHDIGCEWAYLDDLLACEKKLDRTRKALDMAVDALNYANKCIKGGCVDWETHIDKALDQIKTITKKGEK